MSPLDSPRLSPVGFAPADISRLVNRPVVAEHVDQAAALWTRRDRAVNAPHFKLHHLARLDERLHAHLEGVRTAADTGWQLACRALESGEAGACFLVAWLAFQAQSPDRMRLALQCGLATKAHTDALVAALAWIAPSRLQAPLDRLARSSVAAHRRLQLAAAAANRIDGGGCIADAVNDPDAVLRARALRAIGECKRADLADAARAAQDDTDPACRHWAAWSLVVLGEPTAPAQLLAARDGVPGRTRQAVEHAVRGDDPLAGRELVRLLAGDAATLRLGIVAAGALGDPAVVPWLLQAMDQPLHARVAGESFAMITGADLDLDSLKRDAPAGAEDAPGDPEDEDLPWPQVEAAAAWWHGQRERFTFGMRYLAGRPVSTGALVSVLSEGYQRQRAAAAFELARTVPGATLFATAARADWQKHRLAA